MAEIEPTTDLLAKINHEYSSANVDEYDLRNRFKVRETRTMEWDHSDPKKPT